MITAEVVAHSINAEGVEIMTQLLTYPRFIHSELLTHRSFSRNSSSSRAIPVEKIIQQVKDSPVIPIKWLKAHKGMQGFDEAGEGTVKVSTALWLKARDQAVDIAERLVQQGITKQLINRILEPFHHITVVVTATEWDNFFALRDHPSAELHIQELARQMKKAQKESKPSLLAKNQWHLPFITDKEKLLYKPELLIKASVARCARTSYQNHDKSDPDIVKDLELHNVLVGSDPIHASPAEHQATPSWGESYLDYVGDTIHDKLINSNFKGWYQYRKFIENKINVRSFV